jgi:hypothetical protein
MNLEEVKDLPGVQLLILVNNADNKKFIKNQNLERINNDYFYWQVKLGEMNKMEFEQWTWNKVGIGIIFIFLLLCLTLILQKVRLDMGFGFPELPP